MNDVDRDIPVSELYWCTFLSVSYDGGTFLPVNDVCGDIPFGE